MNINELVKNLNEIKLIDIQTDLSNLSSYDISKYPGITIFKEENNTLKIRLASIYILKLSLELLKTQKGTFYDFSEETVYSILKIKLSDRIFFENQWSINKYKDFNEVIDFVSNLIIENKSPFSIDFRRDVKLITTKEEMKNTFLNLVKSEWITKFMLSQGFFFIGIISIFQLFLNGRNIPSWLKNILGFSFISFILISVIILITSMLKARKEIIEINNIRDH